MTSIRLKPCPFCGERLKISAGLNPYARCNTDGCWMNKRQISIPIEDRRQVAEWNSRPGEST